MEAGIEKLFKTHNEYQEKWEGVKESSDRGKIWRKVMLLAGKDEPNWDQKITKQEENNFQTFKPSVDLKPNYLDVESSFIEIMSFIDGAEQYLKTRYRGQVPEEGCSVHLANLINPQWLQALERKGIRKKDLKGVLDLIKEEGELMHPKHQRRMKVLREKRET